MPFLKLARTAARHQIDKARLESELNGEVWSPPTRIIRSNMVKLAASQKDSPMERIAALSAILREMDLAREVRRPSVIARRMCERLGGFNVEQLYVAPYDTMWRDPPDFLGADPRIDDTPQMRKCVRESRHTLINRIRLLKLDIIEAKRRRGEQLIARMQDQAGAEDWSPIVLG